MTKLSDHFREFFPCSFVGGLGGVAWTISEAYHERPDEFHEAFEHASPLFWVLFGLDALSWAVMFAAALVLVTYPPLCLIEARCSKRS